MSRKFTHIVSSKKSNYHVRKLWEWAPLCMSIVFCIVLVFLVGNSNRTDKRRFNEIELKAISLNHSLIRREIINNVDVIWEFPRGGVNTYNGIIFLAHGCNHAHTDFWSNNVSAFECPECIGLPEELAIVRTAIDHHKLVVITASSQDRRSGCWTYDSDAIVIANVLKVFQDRFYSEIGETKNEKLPIFAFGASSGGSFVSQLVDPLYSIGTHLDGFISQISAQSKQNWKLNEEHSLGCAVYITMNRDGRTDYKATMLLSALSSFNTSIASKHIRLPPLPIHESFFSDRIPSLSFDTSKRIFEALLQNEMLTLRKSSEEDEFLNLLEGKYYLTTDPRISDWRSVVTPIILDYDNDSLEPDMSPISEVFNVAYARHEMSRDGVHDALKVCLQRFNTKI